MISSVHWGHVTWCFVLPLCFQLIALFAGVRKPSTGSYIALIVATVVVSAIAVLKIERDALSKRRASFLLVGVFLVAGALLGVVVRTVVAAFLGSNLWPLVGVFYGISSVLAVASGMILGLIGQMTLWWWRTILPRRRSMDHS